MDASELIQFVQQLRLDVKGIADPALGKVLQQVFNLIEEVVQHNQRLRDDNARLRAENVGLRELLQEAGVKPPTTNVIGNPTAPANAMGSAAGNVEGASAGNSPDVKQSKNHSSEKERRAREPRQPRADRRSFRPVRVDRDVVCPVDPASLPPDARFAGYHDVIVQELVVKTDNVRYRCEIWVSPTRGRLCGSLPPDVEGEFGPRLRTLLVSLKYVAGTSLPRARCLVEHFGIEISPASVVNILHDAAARLRPERDAIFQAGLAATTLGPTHRQNQA